jgi:ferredoxin
MYWTSKAMLKKDLTIIGYSDWYGGVSQLPYMPKPYFTDGHPDEIDLKEAEDFGSRMADHALKIFSGDNTLIPKLPEGPDADQLWQPEKNHISAHATQAEQIKKQRIINKEKCNYPKCTLCIDICPTKSINISTKIPEFKLNCIMCYACEGVCPNGAIEIDYEKIFGSEIFHAISKDNPMIKRLKDAEDQGRFRWLVPLEKIGFNTLMWRVTGHPRFAVEDDCEENL